MSDLIRALACLRQENEELNDDNKSNGKSLMNFDHCEDELG